MRQLFFLLFVGVFGLGVAQADTFHFENITNNGNPDVGFQLSVEITEVEPGKIQFEFTNTGDIASSITQVYFDDVDSLLGDSILSLAQSAGVSFAAGDSGPGPNDLPGGHTVGFSADLLAKTTGIPPDYGIGNFDGSGSAEWLRIVIAGNAADVIDSINSGNRVVGVHVQAIGATGGSDSYVDPPRVPEPMSLLLVGAGLLGVVGVMRLRKG